jgi:alanine racemase
MRPTVAEINLGALRANYRALKDHVGECVTVMPIIKANAYGHGAYECARALESEGVSRFGVALLEEAVGLREAGLTSRILVTGSAFEEQIPEFLHHDLEFAVPSLQLAEKIDTLVGKLGAKKPRLHLDIDTGMGRLGASLEDAEGFITGVARLPHVDAIAIYSHFASSDAVDTTFALEQLRRFNSVVAAAEAKGIRVPEKHIANSGAVLHLPDAYFTTVRPGMTLYGYRPEPALGLGVKLQPVMTLRSKIIFVKEVVPGTSISYGRTWKAETRTRVATIPIGYADGYTRRLSGHAQVLVGGRRVPVIGIVTMDQIMVDLGPDAKERIGDEVVLIGKQGNECLLADELAGYSGTIVYEFLTAVSNRVPRIYIE